MSEKITSAVEVTVIVNGAQCSPMCVFFRPQICGDWCDLFRKQLAKYDRCPGCLAKFSSEGEE